MNLQHLCTPHTTFRVPAHPPHRRSPPRRKKKPKPSWPRAPGTGAAWRSYITSKTSTPRWKLGHWNTTHKPLCYARPSGKTTTTEDCTTAGSSRSLSSHAGTQTRSSERPTMLHGTTCTSPPLYTTTTPQWHNKESTKTTYAHTSPRTHHNHSPKKTTTNGNDPHNATSTPHYDNSPHLTCRKGSATTSANGTYKGSPGSTPDDASTKSNAS